MGTSSYDSIFGIGTTKIILAPGATNALYFGPIAGQNTTLIKFFTGGSLQIIGVPYGQTLSPSALINAVGNHYLVDQSEILSFDGPISCYLQAMGATTTVMMLRGKTQET